DEAPPVEHEPPLPPAEVAQAPHPADRPAPFGPGAGSARPAALTDDLNPAQREAVEHRGSPLLIVAGAGSGKTRVLTRRIAHLLGSGEALPGETRAITLTNKAAAEVGDRVGELVGRGARGRGGPPAASPICRAPGRRCRGRSSPSPSPTRPPPRCASAWASWWGRPPAACGSRPSTAPACGSCAAMPPRPG